MCEGPDVQGRIRLPDGVRDHLPGEAAELHAVRRVLLETLDAHDYQRVITPSIEYLDVLRRGTERSEDRIFKLVEPDTGLVIALRTDITPQIARMVATALRDADPPLRLCYAGSVFRMQARNSGERRELHQVGAECVGVPGPDGDAEALSLLAELLSQVGLSAFTLDVGHATFLREALRRAFTHPEERVRAEAALARKDAQAVAALALGAPAPLRPLVEALPTLYGDRGVTARARALTDDDALRGALDEVDAVGAALEERGFGDHLSIDLGEVRGLGYHSGVVFQAFIPGPGRPLGGGGRYDGLTARFGRPMQATGFALDLDAVMEARCRRS